MGESKHAVGTSKHMGSIQAHEGIQTYRGVQTYRVHPKHIGASKCMGAYGNLLSLTKHAFFVLYMYSRHPNIIQTYRGASKHIGVSKHTGGIQTYGDIQMYGGIWTPPWSDKTCFHCVVYVQQTSRHHPNMQGDTQGVSKQYRGHPNIWEHSNVWGHMNTPLV